MDSKKNNPVNELERGLGDRHIQLIAIGGAIGVGLFLGSAQAIQTAGPAIILSYALGGLMIFLVIEALGELALFKPVAGSFSTYATEFVGPWAGFLTGWNYWFMWVVTGMAEITAVGVYFRYWFPEVPQWIPALGAFLAVYIVNLITVKLFGEIEFWFALIKVSHHCCPDHHRSHYDHDRMGTMAGKPSVFQTCGPMTGLCPLALQVSCWPCKW